MEEPSRANRHWVARVRELRDRKLRHAEGVCFVEGIRQVLAAGEGGWPLEALLVDPSRLKSDIAWATVENLRSAGTQIVELSPRDFERVSSRNNPTGIAAIVQWQPLALDALNVASQSLWLVADDVADAGNLGTLVRTGDSLGLSGLITHAGVDPAHPAALRASLGTAFRLPIASAESVGEVFTWCARHGIRTVATSAKAEHAVWDADLTVPSALMVGNEGRGLDQAMIERCDETVLIPMSGTATSLNVGVAAGIILYEAMRQRGKP